MTVPSYMKQFNCIAGACEETCCAGWYIAIDEPTYKKYKKVKKPEMKKRFEKELVVKKGSAPECAAKIKLKNNRCAFLAKDNLCDIYKELGEPYLSETCKMYPRNTNALGERVELSLALSCPEAARQILLCKEPITFSVEETECLPIVGAKLGLQLKSPKHFEDYIVPMRDFLIAIVQEESYGLEQKCQTFEDTIRALQGFKIKQDSKKLMAFLAQGLDKGCLKKDFKMGEGKKTDKLFIESYRSEAFAKTMLKGLVTMRETKKWPSVRYEACYNKMVDALVDGANFNGDAYQKGLGIYEEMMLEKHPYILEHYIVNYIYERLMPINQKTPLESLEELYLYIGLIRLHLIGMAAYDGGLTLEAITTCIQSFTRVFDHNELYMQQIKKIYKTKE